VLVAVAAAMLSWASAAVARTGATPTGVVGLAKPSPVREYAGWLVFSRWDGSAYRLSTWHAGTVYDLPVRSQSDVFDADAGPDSSGKPSVAVSLCDASCDLFVIGLETGDRLRPVRNANTTGHDEIAPTVWKGRLAYARRYAPDDIVPYTKLLAAARSHPSDRIGTLPERRCGAVDAPTCRVIKHTELAGMELWGRWIAQSWRYQPDGFAGFRQNEIRLTDVTRGDTRQIASMITGLGGQTYLGPSIASGRVAFFRACQGDPGACFTNNSGAIRYRISSGRYELAGDRENWSAWAWSGVSDYHVPSAFECSGGDPGTPTEPCAIVRRIGLPWKPVAEHVIRR
jgi:hypothetical protein